MRKFFLFVVMLAVGMTSAFADCQDGPYGLQINGTKVIDAPKFGDPDAQGRVQYKASCVELAVGDEIKLINQSCDATWMVDLDPYGSYQKFTGGKTAGKLTCNEAGSYDFYIKLSGSVGDLVYVGPGDNCSGGGGGGDCQDGPYGLQINGTTIIDAPSFGEPDDQGRAQYKAGCVKLVVGDKVKLINQSCAATWMVDLDPYGSYQKFTGGKSAGEITCNEAGNYDFYIKLSGEVGDVLYIGPGDGCPEPYDPSAKYYIAGSGTSASDWCCGKDWDPAGCELVGGKVTYTNLPKGTYMFKITKGTWDSNWGSESLDGMCTSTGVTGDDGRNITFKIYKKADVEITFDGSICVKITGDETPDVPERPDYAKSVPEKCPDVMLQAFYYDSYDDKAPGNVTISGTTKLGDTKWSTLLKNSGDIGMYFDMVWLPPSGKSEGGTGYHQTQYSNQNSAWGSKDELVEFINRMHSANTKVVADIVINHAGCKSSWCDFYTQYFTPYGTFEPVASWICKTDEVNQQSEDMTCKNAATGTDDGGYNGQDNYASARDWAHADTRVQDMMKAYLKWMKNVIGYDGWRYDYAQGFKGKYINMYNSASKNYFSVCEYWNGEMGKIKDYLSDCNWNTTVFDFSNKYCAIQGIADGNYSKCVGSGLQGTGDGRYAVTFVDSHDTYFGCKGGRDNQDEIGGCGKSMEDYNKDRVLAANAYILSRPGIPCVFYPHWMKYKDAINKMVMARQITGVHSESVCSDESSGDGFYKVTVAGTKGSIRLLLGPNSGYGDTPSGYSLAYKGGNFAMYYKTNEAETPRLKMTAPQKFTTQNFTVTITAAALSGTPEIYYTTDGADPTTSSTKYTSPFTISGTKTVKAIAVLNGKSSAVMSATYTYKAPQTTPILLRFTHDDTWTGDAYVFLWDGGSAGGWPGTKMSLGVDGWYRYQLPEGVKSTKFIFNNGNKGLQTGDLVTDCDVCYQWRNGCEEQDEECGQIDVPFGISLSPESSKFRDQTVGIDVTITAVGVPAGQTPTIYYTTNGTDPTTSSTSSTTNPLKLNFKNTTELRAMAVAGSQKTSIVKATYTYKEPQQGPITVSFKEPSWKKVNLYAWTTDASQTPLLGAWPGTTLTQQDKDGAYYHTFDAQYKTVNIIWNNGSVQSSDILVDENTCFTWDATEKDAVAHDCEQMAIMSVQEAPLLNLNAPMYNVLGQQVDATYSGIVIQNGYKYLIIK